MKRRSSNKYKLIPSKQSRSDSTAPMSFIPAIPVRLVSEQGGLHYALIDTAAEISIADESILDKLDYKVKPYSYSKYCDFNGQIAALKVMYISIFVCTPLGAPWLVFHNVPLAITKRNLGDRQRLILGYDSMLSNLRLSLDYPRKELRLSAPIEFEILSEKSGKEYLPSSINEAENLIRMGSYRAALPMIVSGLEEALAAKINEINYSRRITYLLKQNWLPNRMKGELKKVVDLRNHAVHGFGLVKIEKKDAQRALRTIKKIIEQISYFNT